MSLTPVIDATSCVHALSVVASCQRCVDVCPTAALALEPHALEFDAEACIGCTLCRAACPQKVISFPEVRFDPFIDDRRDAALVACAKTEQAGRGVVPCVHGLSVADLDTLWDACATTLSVTHGDCSTCACSTPATLELRLAAVNLVHVSQGNSCVTLKQESEPAWKQRQVNAMRAGYDMDHGKRALFGRMLRRDPASPDGPLRSHRALEHNVPVLLEEVCAGCDACIRICPHGALAKTRDGGTLAYAISASDCVGCGLCVDVCQEDAIEVRVLRTPAQGRVALIERQCRQCGVPFHVPERNLALRGQECCPICARRQGGTGLFQVRE